MTTQIIMCVCVIMIITCFSFFLMIPKYYLQVNVLCVKTQCSGKKIQNKHLTKNVWRCLEDRSHRILPPAPMRPAHVQYWPPLASERNMIFECYYFYYLVNLLITCTDQKGTLCVTQCVWHSDVCVTLCVCVWHSEHIVIYKTNMEERSLPHLLETPG